MFQQVQPQTRRTDVTSSLGRRADRDASSGPVRVAYVVHTFDMGGMERCVARLVNHLDRSQFEPMIVCLSRNGNARSWVEAADVPIIELEKRPGNDPRIVTRMARALAGRKVDIVHSHNWGTLLETSVARRLARTACHVHAERGMELADLEARSWRRKLRGLCARWALNRADAVVAVAESVRAALVHRCGRLKRDVLVIPNGVDAPTPSRSAPSREQLRQTLGISPEALVVGSVGRLVAVKDFGMAIDAVGQLVRQGGDVHLLLVGDGPEKDRMAAKAQAAGVARRVHLVGQQSDVAAWLAVVDVYINSSLNEGMSQSILEAMSLGLPMVVTDVGDNAVLAGGERPCGLVVPPGNPQAAAAAVADLCGNLEQKREMSQNALARYNSTYRIADMVGAYQRLYRELVNNVRLTAGQTA